MLGSVGIGCARSGVYRVVRGLVLAAAMVAAMGSAAGADPRVKTTGENEATGDIFKEYAGYEKAYGFVPNDVEVMSQDLRLLRLHAAFGQGVLAQVRNLTLQQKSMIGLIVGTTLSNEYLKKLEGWELLRQGLKEDQVRRIEQDFQSAGLKSEDVAALKFVQKMASSTGDLAEQDFADLRWDGWTDPGIIEITMVTSYFIYLGRMTQVLGVVPDSYPEVKR